MANDCQEKLIEDGSSLVRTEPSDCRSLYEVVGLDKQLPSFILIKDMPNCIEVISGTLINKIFMIDEV